jgi:hypothetical protein
MARPKDPKLLEKADDFLAKYVNQGEKKNITQAALEARPEMSPDTAYRWGRRVLEDPDARKKLHAIEQGALAKLYELADIAIDRLAQILNDETTSKNIQVKVIDMIVRRVLGGIPDTVILAKFSMFDNEDTRNTLKEQLREKMLSATYERRDRTTKDDGIRTSEPEAPKAASVDAESAGLLRR